jgi:peptidoglycan/xylan/chitin deacetylase (PgdA/CDA1 family)
MILHRVRPQRDPLFPGELDADQFRDALKKIVTRFNVIDLADGVRRLYDGSLPPASLAISFDDGYADNLTVAAPILAAFDVTATVFVASGYLQGQVMWNDRVIEAVRQARGDVLDLSDVDCGVLDTSTVASRRSAIGQLLAKLKYLDSDERDRRADLIQKAARAEQLSGLMLNRDQVRKLAELGFSIGAHTVSHPILARLDPDDAQNEIGQCKTDLETVTQRPVQLFAYPNGKMQDDYLRDHVDMVQRAGYAAAFTTEGGAGSAATDRYQLPRFTPWRWRGASFDVLMLRNLRSVSRSIAPHEGVRHHGMLQSGEVPRRRS